MERGIFPANPLFLNTILVSSVRFWNVSSGSTVPGIVFVIVSVSSLLFPLHWKFPVSHLETVMLK